MGKLTKVGILVCLAAIALGMLNGRSCENPPSEDGEKAYPFCHFGQVYNYIVWVNWIGSYVRQNFKEDLGSLDVDAYKEAVDSIYAEGNYTHLSELIFPGWESQIDDYRILAEEMNANEDLSLLSRIVVDDLLSQGVNLQRIAFDFFAEYPETSHIRIRAPIAIIGLHRTGSTFLQRLLSLDPQAHSFDLWKRIADPFSNRTMEEYSQEADAEFDQVKYLSPGGLDKTFQYHMMSAELPEEDIMLLYDATPSMQDTPWQLLPVLSAHFNNSMAENNKIWAYLHFKRRLQMWSTNKNRFVTHDEAALKEMHWVLKAPLHSAFMRTFLPEFPLARIVICHRDFEAALLSYVTLSASFMSFLVADDSANVRQLALVLRDYFVTLVERLLKFLDKDKNGSHFHISYEELAANPIETVKALYRHFDMEFSAEFEAALEEYIRTTPSTQSPRRYTREQLGLDRDDIYSYSDKVNEYNSRYNAEQLRSEPTK